MEIVESAACGISEREFEVTLEDNEIATMLDFVKASLEKEQLNEDMAGKVIEKIESDQAEGEVVLKFKETDIVAFYKGLKSALDNGVECDLEFTDDFFSYAEQIVGSVLHE
jgi:hypothetical protein